MSLGNENFSRRLRPTAALSSNIHIVLYLYLGLSRRIAPLGHQTVTTGQSRPASADRMHRAAALALSLPACCRGRHWQ
eukprot:COSAG06_NODE_1745_length_8496_cov_3.733595_6_plen_78_part_00